MSDQDDTLWFLYQLSLKVACGILVQLKIFSILSFRIAVIFLTILIRFSKRAMISIQYKIIIYGIKTIWKYNWKSFARSILLFRLQTNRAGLHEILTIWAEWNANDKAAAKYKLQLVFPAFSKFLFCLNLNTK